MSGVVWVRFNQDPSEFQIYFKDSIEEIITDYTADSPYECGACCTRVFMQRLCWQSVSDCSRHDHVSSTCSRDRCQAQVHSLASKVTRHILVHSTATARSWHPVGLHVHPRLHVRREGQDKNSARLNFIPCLFIPSFVSKWPSPRLHQRCQAARQPHRQYIPTRTNTSCFRCTRPHCHTKTTDHPHIQRPNAQDREDLVPSVSL